MLFLVGQALDRPACESGIRVQGWGYPAAHFNHIGKLKAGKARLGSERA